MKIIFKIIFVILVVILSISGIVYSLYGGGERWIYTSPASILGESKLEIVASLPFPPGNIALNFEDRIFITIHPESKPVDFKVVEIVDGKYQAFPDEISQTTLYSHPQGIRVDSKDRVCTIDHGDNGIKPARFVCVSIESKKVEIDYTFPREVAPLLSYLQDFVPDSESRFYYFADVNFFGKNPGLVVYDSKENRSRRILEDHYSTSPENWKIFAYNGPMERLGGLIVLKAGVDSIAIDRNDEWLYYAPMNHRKMFRILIDKISDLNFSNQDLEKFVEVYSDKILSDGILMDDEGNIFLTDVEHQSIARITTDRKLENWISSSKFRWPDGLALGKGNFMYVADSDIPNIALQSQDHIKASAPYYLFRFPYKR